MAKKNQSGYSHELIALYDKLIDLEDRTIELNPNQGVTIPKGVMHRPRAPKKTVLLMVETSEIKPTGD